jgi:hypothetical protein
VVAIQIDQVGQDTRGFDQVQIAIVIFLALSSSHRQRHPDLRSGLRQ